jgi:hypothetical protein
MHQAGLQAGLANLAGARSHGGCQVNITLERRPGGPAA